MKKTIMNAILLVFLLLFDTATINFEFLKNQHLMNCNFLNQKMKK